MNLEEIQIHVGLQAKENVIPALTGPPSRKFRGVCDDDVPHQTRTVGAFYVSCRPLSLERYTCLLPCVPSSCTSPPYCYQVYTLDLK